MKMLEEAKEDTVAFEAWIELVQGLVIRHGDAAVDELLRVISARPTCPAKQMMNEGSNNPNLAD